MLAAATRHVVTRHVVTRHVATRRTRPARLLADPPWRSITASANLTTQGAPASAIPLKADVSAASIDASRAEKSWLAKRPELYWRLAKGKLTVWVAISALPGYFLALPAAIDPCVLAALSCGTLLTSGSAQSINQLYEVDRDARMGRTAHRPLPSGRLTKSEAMMFACTSGSVGLGILAVGANPLTAAISGATIATYAGLYTPMKVLTPYNTHVGAISGSMPTLLGFSAALGTGIFASPWFGHAVWLFAMQTLWQMPHFYALAWIHRADYIKGGYSMFPLSDATGHKTAAMSKPYLVAMCAMPWVASAAGLASWMLPVGAALPSYIWWQSLKKFEKKPNAASCRRFFLGSLSYLLATLALFTAYARAEQPRDTKLLSDSEVDDSASAPLPPACPLEPAWRARLSNWFSELCPHEQIRHFLLGALNGSCPFSAQKKA